MYPHKSKTRREKNFFFFFYLSEFNVNIFNFGASIVSNLSIDVYAVFGHAFSYDVDLDNVFL